MIRVGEIEIPSPPGFLEQGADNLLPHPSALIFQQATVTRFRRGSDVVRQVFPLAACLEDIHIPLSTSRSLARERPVRAPFGSKR